jgi:hypothetical protein
VVLTGHSTSVLEYKVKLFDAPRLLTDVFVKMEGRWQLVVHDVFELPIGVLRWQGSERSTGHSNVGNLRMIVQYLGTALAAFLPWLPGLRYQITLSAN